MTSTRQSFVTVRFSADERPASDDAVYSRLRDSITLRRGEDIAHTQITHRNMSGDVWTFTGKVTIVCRVFGRGPAGVRTISDDAILPTQQV